jgi:phospholipase C
MALLFNPTRFFTKISRFALLVAFLTSSISPEFAPSAFALQAAVNPIALPWPAGLPVYDHVVIVIEENKDFEQIIGSKNAPYINDVLRKQGAVLTQMYGEEHHSQGNYFWLFSGGNQGVGFTDQVPDKEFKASNLGEELIRTGHSFKGYSEGLPTIGSTVGRQGLYARKHVPWVSFSNVPNGATVADSSNLRFPQDWPADFSTLPTVSFVIPNLINDMHDGGVPSAVAAGDKWLKRNLDAYYEWAKQNNSLLILTFDESAEFTMAGGLTNPANPDASKRNRIPTILAGAHIKAGEYPEDKGVTHVNILRTLEAMYKLNRSGTQQLKALKANIADGFTIKDIFDAAAVP